TMIPERNGERSVQFADTIRPHVLVSVHDDVAVGARPQSVAAIQKPLAELAIVVNLAVEDQNDRASLVEQRLVAGLEVDDAEAPVCKGHVRQLVLDVAVSTAV